MYIHNTIDTYIHSEKWKTPQINATFIYTSEECNGGKTSMYSIYFCIVSIFYTVYFVFLKGLISIFPHLKSS